MKDIVAVLQTLDSLKPLKVITQQTKLSLWSRSVFQASVIFILAIALFVVSNQIFVFSAISIVIFKLLAIWSTLLISSILLILEILNIWESYKSKQSLLESLILVFQHDKKAVEYLICFKHNELESTRFWLQLRLQRIESKMQLFFGGSEKLALFSVISIALVVGEKLIPEIKNMIFGGFNIGHMNVNSFYFLFIILAFCVVVGFVGAGISVRVDTVRYQYYLTLLELAITEKNKLIKKKSS